MGNFKKILEEALKKSFKKVTVIILIAVIVLFSLAVSYFSINDVFSKKVSKHIKDNPVTCQKDVSDIQISDEQVTEMEKVLESMGISKEKLGLTSEDIKKMFIAEAVCQEINRGVVEEDGKYYGRVYVKKAKDSTDELEDLKYIEFDEFQKLNAKIIGNYFSINEDKLCIAHTAIATDSEGESKEEVTIEKLEYKSQLEPYIMPVEFLLDLAIITNNSEFVRTLTNDVIKNTKIVIAVLQETENIETEITEKYNIHTEITTSTSIGETSTDTNDTPVEKKRTITTSYMNPSVVIASVKTWFIEQEYTYNKVVGEEKLPPEVNELPNGEPIINSSSNQYIQPDDGTPVVVNTTIANIVTNHTITSQTTTTTEKYKEGITKEPLDKAEEFLELLKTRFKTNDSNIKEAPIDKLVDGAGILFKMLQNSERTQTVEYIMRYVLYLYTGNDYGVTELDLSLFEANNFKTISNSNLSTYLRQFSHSSEAPQSANGKYYKMYGDGVGWPTIGNADLQWKSHHGKFNIPGKVSKDGEEIEVENVEEYVNTYLIRGAEATYTNDEINMMQIYIEKQLVDNIGDSVQETYYNVILNATQGLDLSRQQLYALTSIAYNFGSLPIINGKSFKEVYEEGMALYDINSWEHNLYIWDNWWCLLGGGATGHIPSRDASFETYVKGIYDFSQSSAGTVFSRNYYIYYTESQLANFDYAPNKTVTRNTSNIQEIFKYEENAVGTNGITNIDDLELTTYTNSVGKTFVEYKQNVGPWASMSYGDNTIAVQGCSITSLAIMTSGYGYNFTPEKWASTSLTSITGEAKKYAKNSIAVDIGAEGSANKTIKAANKKDIQEHLETGDVVIIHVLGNGRGYNNPYTSNQHWMALLDISEDGKQVYVSNPSSGKSNGWADIDEVLKSLCCYIKVSN